VWRPESASGRSGIGTVVEPRSRYVLTGKAIPMNSRPSILAAALALALLAGSSCARDTRPLDQRLTEALAARLRQFGVRGASAAVILPDRSVHRIVAGTSHDSVAMRPDMLFAIGSITKNYVAALVLRLAEDGALSLEDPLYRWLPRYPRVDSTVTIRQLLSHRSGIAMFWENQRLWDDLKAYRDSVFTPEVVLTYIGEPDFAPDSGFRYSNTNYLLLAMIATRATRSTLSAELRTRFWRPLGLASTYLSMEDSIPPERLAHVWGDNFEGDGSNRDLTFLPRAAHESITYGSAGVFTTAEELARWSHALFHGELISRPSLERMTEFRPAGRGLRGSYGLGLQAFAGRLTSGERVHGHGGGNIGTSAYVAYLPDFDVSLAVMINYMHGTCPARILGDFIEIVTDHLRQAGLHESGGPPSR